MPDARLAMKWIGKIVGGILGGLVLGPVGAALGVLLGHQFDEPGVPRQSPAADDDLVAIGASWGGLDVFREVLRDVPAELDHDRGVVTVVQRARGMVGDVRLGRCAEVQRAPSRHGEQAHRRVRHQPLNA